MSNKHDVLVIGAGPGGYVAAIRAAQLGLDAACVDPHERLGGTCLRVGCIPSKAMLESSEKYAEATGAIADHGVQATGVKLDLDTMLKRKDQVVEQLTGGIRALFKKNKVTAYTGHARFNGDRKVAVDGADGTTDIEADHIIIATGSRPASLPGIEFDGERVGSSTEALSYGKVPKRLCVIGAGYIGLEMGSVWNRLGSDVTVLEYLDRALPAMDGDLAKEAQKALKKQGLTFRFGAKVTGVKKQKTQCVVEVEDGEPVKCDRVLVAVGRQPVTEDLAFESVGIETDRHGFIPVDEKFATAANGIYAVGDAIGGKMLAHKAQEEGVACVERIATGYGHVNYEAIPSVVYTHPEVASVGRTEEELKERGVEYRSGAVPFGANGRARTLNDPNGKVKVLADAKSDRLLGVHIIGPRAGDLIAEAAVALDYGASAEDLARSPHAHPTLAESIKEAALAVDGRAIHA